MQHFLKNSASQTSTAYRGILIGAVAGVVGTLAMGQYWTRIQPLIEQATKPKDGQSEGADSGDQSKADKPKPDQNVISPLGQQHKPGESSTAALGRIAYQTVEGHKPGKQTAAALSETAHWGFGVLTGSAYGVVAEHVQTPFAGALYGAGLWAVMDEGVVPLLGLQDGPKASDLQAHAHRLGAHVAYGLALGLTAWLLDLVLPE